MTRNLLFAVFLFISCTLFSQAVWKKHKISCPVCEQNNKLFFPTTVNAAFGKESHFQYVIFPYNDYRSVFSCKSCRFSVLMEDFIKMDSVVVEKIKKVNYAGYGVGKYRNYSQINITERLMMAELTYKEFNKGPEFWCMFYRICGFHFMKEGYEFDAREYYQKALNLAIELLHNRFYGEGREKEFMFIMGAMYNQLDEADSAYKYIREANLRNYAGNSSIDENPASKERFLTHILGQFSAHLRKQKVERMKNK